MPLSQNGTGSKAAGDSASAFSPASSFFLRITRSKKHGLHYQRFSTNQNPRKTARGKKERFKILIVAN